MKFAENFLLAIRPGYTALKNPDSKGESLRFYSLRNTIELQITRSGAGGTVVADPRISYVEESEFWLGLRAEAPWALLELRDSPDLLERGMYARHEQMLSMSPPEFKAREEAFEALILQMHRLFVEAVGGVVASRASLRALRVRKTKSASTFEVIASLRLPGVSKPVRTVTQFFPSPFEADAWSMHVRMPTVSNEFAAGLQERLKTAEKMIQARLGIQIGNVMNGLQVYL